MAIFTRLGSWVMGSNCIQLLFPRDMQARDEPTRTCCGPLPSWVSKIKTLEKIKNIDFENQD
jgi:hypothetical protein